MIFYLGTHMEGWLEETDIPLMVSRRRLLRRKRLPVARGPWVLDSGGFTELSLYGHWTISKTQYVEEVKRFTEDVGNLAWCSPMDWMCEPVITERTGLTVREHQERTVESYLDLRASGLPVIPVLQGFLLDDYLACWGLYDQNGVDLLLADTVGLGSVCRRQSTSDIEQLISLLAGEGLRLHGFGVKTRGLARYGALLRSSDSLAWSYNARKNEPLPGHSHIHCNNCLEWALRWREKVLSGGVA